MWRKFFFTLLVLLYMPWLFAQVNINTASEQELTSLHGIGKVKAAAIVAHRKEYGAFRAKEEIKLVKGIGEKTYAAIEAEIIVGTATHAKSEKKTVVRATDKRWSDKAAVAEK